MPLQLHRFKMRRNLAGLCACSGDDSLRCKVGSSPSGNPLLDRLLFTRCNMFPREIRRACDYRLMSAPIVWRDFIVWHETIKGGPYLLARIFRSFVLTRTSILAAVPFTRRHTSLRSPPIDRPLRTSPVILPHQFLMSVPDIFQVFDLCQKPESSAHDFSSPSKILTPLSQGYHPLLIA